MTPLWALYFMDLIFEQPLQNNKSNRELVFQFKYFQFLLPHQQSQTACRLIDTLSNLITVMFRKLHASWMVESHSNQNGFQFLELHSTKTDHNFLNWISFQRCDINEWHIIVLNWHSAHIFNFYKFSETWDDLYNKEILGKINKKFLLFFKYALLSWTDLEHFLRLGMVECVTLYLNTLDFCKSF